MDPQATPAAVTALSSGFCTCLSPHSPLWEVPHWVVTLESGLVIYQGEIQATTPSSWHRLKTHLERMGGRITALGLRFRSHKVWPLPEYARGYFFRRRMAATIGGPSLSFGLIGWLDEQDQVHLQHYWLPHLILHEEEIRPASTVESCLIRNP